MYFRQYAVKGIVLCLIGAVLAFPGVEAAAADYPIERVRSGQWGRALTVFRGFDIESFSIKVVDVLPQAGIDGGALILVEVHGANVKNRGGVSLGMSGSPVYIDGRLVGAISIAFPLSDGTIAGVTPIASMRAAAGLKYETGRAHPLRPGAVDGKEFLALGAMPEGVDPELVLVGAPAYAPVMVSGLGERSFEFLKRKVGRSHLHFFNRAGVGAVDAGDRALEPGSAVGIQLTNGDIQITAIGTVTAVDGDEVLLFGHPFLLKGPVRFFLSHGYVHTVIDTLSAAFKMASPAGLVGTALGDHSAAVTGRIGIFPRIVPVEVRVVDLDTGRTADTNVQIVRDKDIMPDLLATVLLQALDTAVDRIGEGTAAVWYKMDTDYNRRSVERRDAYYSRYDISAFSLGEIYELALLLMENVYEEVNVTRVQIEVEVQRSRRTATIENVELEARPPMPDIASAELTVTFGATEAEPVPPPEHDPDPEPDPDPELDPELDPESGPVGEDDAEKRDEEIEYQASPGDEVVFDIMIKPYRQDKTVKQATLLLPDDIPAGTLQFSVRSGGWVSYISPRVFDIDEDDEYYPIYDGSALDESESLDDIFDDFEERGRSDEILVECISFEPAPPVDELPDPDAEAGAGAGAEAPPVLAANNAFDCADIEVSVVTGWVIEGEKEILLEVLKP